MTRGIQAGVASQASATVPENFQEPPSAGDGEAVDSVYLCQVGEGVSCGACCGLYNTAEPSETRLESMLRERTEAFAGVPRTIDGIDDFRMRIEGWTPEDRPFPQFHHCAFLGLVGEKGQRVGCLLHPEAQGNDGVDWRGLSYYGGLACRSYFCPSVRLLHPRWLMALRQAFDHWYLYGLIVTERALLTAFFDEIEARIGRPVIAKDFASGTTAARLLRSFAALKIGWPYRRKDAFGPCNYFFENGEYPRPEVELHAGHFSSSRYETIFRELESAFRSEEMIADAEAELEVLFMQVAAVLEGGCEMQEAGRRGARDGAPGQAPR
ncbi:MAG: hypothetical protein ACOWWM_13805 [Desulfobacterales bacterium]